MRMGPFTLATLVGQVPAGMTYSYLFQEVGHPPRFLIAAASSFLALVVLGIGARRLLLRRRRGAT
jgi:uncharacterized membrane protein YdjX (TVP38/TMEM64 family)